jgi:hypothetical protein
MQPGAPLSPAERRRYSRQLLLREISDEGQRALCAARAELPACADPNAAEVARDYLSRAGLTADAAAASVSVEVPDSSAVAALAGAPSLQAAASTLAGAFAAVEAIKALVGAGHAAKLPKDLSLGGFE